MRGSVTLTKPFFPEIQLKKGIFSSKYIQNFMLRMHQNASQSIYISKYFHGGMPPDPPSRGYVPSALVVHTQTSQGLTFFRLEKLRGCSLFLP